jgi:hypothetical protein
MLFGRGRQKAKQNDEEEYLLVQYNTRREVFTLLKH